MKKAGLLRRRLSNMFEYVLCRAYKTSKGKLIEDKKFALMVFDTLEKSDRMARIYF